ncbi:hypothetical protein [Streptomyces sp. NPDC055990]|uniref:hypothetical protein n=1 Tax=Streptomyces sp. NPDC055990 TaxID=3345672 RepID=UPI0035E2E903
MNITDQPGTCECRTTPWVTIEMLGGLHSTDDSGIRWVDADRDRIAFHTQHADTACVWSGIYVAVDGSIPPSGIKAPVSTRAGEVSL